MADQQLFDSAFAYHLKGNLVVAETGYQALLKLEPGHVSAKHYLGVLKHQQGFSEEGINLIKEAALILDASSASRFNDLGNLFAQSEAFDLAIAAFQDSLKLKADDVVVWNNLGSIFHRQKQFQQAEQNYRIALKYDEHYLPALNNLANLLAEIGQDEESSYLACLAYIQPPLVDKPLKVLAFAYYRLGRIAQAAECYRDWLKSEPENTYAKLHLAACTGEGIPERSPSDYVVGLFNEMASFFEEKLLTTLSYTGSQIISDLLKDFLPKHANLLILDAGCGTGLIAPVLQPYAQELVGVDLSSAMLAKAEAKNIYHLLVEDELSHYLALCERHFDLIAMADTLIYFGEISALFKLIKHALQPEGIFVFTVEKIMDNTDKPVNYSLSPTGRYSHDQSYIYQTLKHLGFNDIFFQDVVVRTEFGKPILGFGVRATLKNNSDYISGFY